MGVGLSLRGISRRTDTSTKEFLSSLDRSESFYRSVVLVLRTDDYFQVLRNALAVKLVLGEAPRYPGIVTGAVRRGAQVAEPERGIPYPIKPF